MEHRIWLWSTIFLLPFVHSGFNMFISNIINRHALHLRPIILHDTVPTCSNCIHFIPDRSFVYLGKCKMRGEKGLVDGHIVYEYAEKMRNDNNKCGISGAYYIEIPTSDERQMK